MKTKIMMLGIVFLRKRIRNPSRFFLKSPCHFPLLIYNRYYEGLFFWRRNVAIMPEFGFRPPFFGLVGASTLRFHNLLFFKELGK